MASNDRETSIRGWLLVLCLCLAVWQPFNLAVLAANALSALPVRGWPLALVLAARVLATAIGVGAAIAILRRHTGAVFLAHSALLLWVVVELFVFATSFFPNNRAPGETPLYVAATLGYYGAWSLYLIRSSRVRRTLG